jgi:hypothetical protein
MKQRKTMKQRKPYITHTARAGSTLTEVLISVMVLGIGVTSVAYLFPISVLQAVRANHITQATILRYNAEAAIDALDLSNRYIFFGGNRLPGAPGDDDLVNGVNFSGWNPGPDGRPGRAGVDDDGNGITDYDPTGIPDGAELGWPVSDDYPIWDTGELLSPGTDDEEVILIDPIGFWRMGADTVLSANRNGTPPPLRARFFGWQDANNDGQFNPGAGEEWTGNPGPPIQWPLRRITGGHRGNTPGVNSGPNRTYYGPGYDPSTGNPLPPLYWNYEFPESVADQLVTLKDQYVTELDAPAFSAAGVLDRVQLASNVDGNPMDDIVANFISNNIPVQVVLFDENGDGLVRNVTNASNGKVIVFTPDLPDADGDGNPDRSIERAVIQAQNFDFTWLLTATIRNTDALPVFDCVVFYKREFSDADEQLFVMRLGEDFNGNGNLDAGEDLNNNGNPDVLNNVLRFNHAGTDKPQIKKGSYLFDVENGEWYGIANIVDQTTTQTTFVIDRPLRDDNQNGWIRGAFMAGIVDVFPLGRKD